MCKRKALPTPKLLTLTIKSTSNLSKPKAFHAKIIIYVLRLTKKISAKNKVRVLI